MGCAGLARKRRLPIPPFTSHTASGGGSSSPGFEIGYDQITASVNITSGTESAGTTLISCAAHTFDGAPVLVSVFSPRLNPAGATSAVVISLFESTTQLGRILLAQSDGTGVAQTQVMSGFRFTPTAGSHTYTLTAFMAPLGGTWIFAAGAGGTSAFVPAYVRFTKV